VVAGAAILLPQTQLTALGLSQQLNTIQADMSVLNTMAKAALSCANFSSLGFSVMMQLFKEDSKNNIIILLPILIIYSFPNLLYQEYVEPLILIIFFLALKTNLQKIYFNNISFSNFIFLSYFTIYLIGSIYFKHFAFDSYEKWIIFLNAQ
jgi:hypothetical protein